MGGITIPHRILILPFQFVQPLLVLGRGHTGGHIVRKILPLSFKALRFAFVVVILFLIVRLTKHALTVLRNQISAHASALSVSRSNGIRH